MKKVRCVGLIPAEQTARKREGLNVLVMAVSESEEAETARIALFGSLSGAPKLLTEKMCTLKAGEHAHLYFHIPAACFADDFWDGEECEELTLYAGTDAPETSGELVFAE